MPDESQLSAGILENFRDCLELREKYIKASLQRPEDDPKNLIQDHDEAVKYGITIEDPLPPKSSHVYHIGDDGVIAVYASKEDYKLGKAIWEVPTLREYYLDAEFILNSVVNSGPSRTLAYRRLKFLEAQFGLYQLLHGNRESEEQKQAPHRDFYNVRKVDNHIHHSAAMNAKHMLRFIKTKLKSHPDDVVVFRDDKYLTLAEVFKSLNLTAYDLNIDKLDMHAHQDSFHRFDRFNLKYNPVGEARLREIFMKTDNLIKGKYLAEITQELLNELEANKYVMTEYRLSIYGRNRNEWSKLAAWVVDNGLMSYNVRWMIRIPRLYDAYKLTGAVNSFEDLLINIFEPLFEVTKDPSKDPKLHLFLKRVVGFDCVDDESKQERRFHKKFPFPKFWESKSNPPYSYYTYYLYANLAFLNQFRKTRGFNLITFRPHCGEAGDPEHLVYGFLVSAGINHGILLRKVPSLQYLFYLAQVGISMSPLSNNALFLTFDRNPFLEYFHRGLNVALSTDDPLQFHYTKEPLIEEYSVAAQIWKLSSVDMCEIAKNSVVQSGFELAIKKQWLGPQMTLKGQKGNDVAKSNVPSTRAWFRDALFTAEHKFLETGVTINETFHNNPDIVGSSVNLENCLHAELDQI